MDGVKSYIKELGDLALHGAVLGGSMMVGIFVIGKLIDVLGRLF